MLSGLLNKHGLNARVAESESVSAGNIISLKAAKAKLVCLSFLSIKSSSAQVRYLVRRLRRILPSGSIILLVGCWTDGAAGATIKALKETAEADAYATSLHEAAEIAVNAARPRKTRTANAYAPCCRSPGDEQPRGGSFG